MTTNGFNYIYKGHKQDVEDKTFYPFLLPSILLF